MRYRLAQLVVLAVALRLVGVQVVCAQASPQARTGTACPSSSDGNDKQSSDPEISIAGVTFSGFLQMAVSDQEEIAASIKERTYRISLDQATNEVLEIARSGWQNRGYFKAEVNGYATTLNSSAAARLVVLNIHVAEGLRYILGGITFTHNRAVSKIEALRPFFFRSKTATFSPRRKSALAWRISVRPMESWATSTLLHFRTQRLTMKIS
jgi:hypothetical protein